MDCNLARVTCSLPLVIKMGMRSGCLTLLLVTWLLAGADVAAAATFQYGSYVVANEQDITILTPNDISGGAGQVKLIGSGRNTGESLFVWCLDIFAYLEGSGVYQVGPLTTAGSGTPSPSLTPTQISEIGSLIVHGNALINKAFDVSAATQLAIWEVEYGTTFTYNGLDPQASNEAKQYLTNVAPGGLWDSSKYRVTLLSEAGNQNMGVAATPLPSTWTMMLIGVAGFSFFAHRGSLRKRQDTADGTAVA
jgi:hypothetical protein